MTEIFAVVVGTVVAWYAGHRHDEGLRWRRKRTFALALAAEARYLAGRAQRLASGVLDLGKLNVALPAPVHDAFLQHADVFSREEAGVVLAGGRSLYELQFVLSYEPSDSPTRLAARRDVARFHVASLAEALAREGRVLERIV